MSKKNPNKAHLKQYRDELNRKTLTLAKLLYFMIVPIAFGLLFQDTLLLHQTHLVIWHMAMLVCGLMFLVLAFTWFPRNMDLVVPSHAAGSLVIVICGCGLVRDSFVLPDLPANAPAGLMGAYLTAMLGVLPFAGGIRKYLKYIMTIPLAVLVWYLVVVEKIATMDAAIFSNPLICVAVIIAIAEVQERQEFKDFLMRRLAEERLEEIKASADKLTAAETTLRTLIDAADESMLLGDLDGTIRELNITLARRLGEERDNMLGKNIYSFFSPEVSAQRAQMVKHILQTKKTGNFEDLRDGISFEHSVYPIFDATGKVVQAVLFSRDITEKRRAEKDREIMQEQLIHAEKHAALGDVVGGIAHEILNPIAVISGMGRQIEKRLVKAGLHLADEKLLAMLGSIQKHAARVTEVINSMQTISRDSHADPFAAASLPRIIQNCVLLCRDRFISQSVNLTVDELPEATLECRMGQIAQVLINLLNNARDAVEGKPEKWVRIHVSQLGDWLEVAISDSGCGVPADVRQKIFDPFFSTKEVGMGSGLGLSLSKSIALAHHGDLYYDTASPHTKFVLRLPKKQSPAMENPANAA